MSKITLIFPTSLEIPACLHSNSTVTLQELRHAGPPSKPDKMFLTCMKNLPEHVYNS